MTEFSLGHQSIRSYRRLSYTAWHALAEFVDNSTQAYFDHSAELDAVYEKEGRPLSVDIVYDSDAGTITITDNSYGMDRDTLDRAMTVGMPPPDPTGRSRYGMGLKTAACWLGNVWTVRTAQLGHGIEYTVTVDVERIALGNTTLPTEEEPVDPTAHYTEIVISDLNVTFRGRRVGKVKDYLSSMYREDLRSNRLRLTWQGDELEWKSARGQFLKDSAGKEYRRHISEVVEVDSHHVERSHASVEGWAGVLESGGRSQAGFSIFHNGRMIKGYPDSWRPQEIFGQEQGSNNLINQRLVGEFHLDDFPVTHTKDDLVWSDEEQQRVERAIREEIKDYLVIAERARTRTRSGPQQGSIRKAAKSVASDLKDAAQRHSSGSTPRTSPEREQETSDTTSRYSDIEADIDVVLWGKRLRAYFSDEESNEALYAAITLSDSEGVVLVANLKHPFLNQVVSAETLDVYLRLVLIDAAALSEEVGSDHLANLLEARDSLMRILTPRRAL
jgi:hypothetical protein